MAWRSHGDTNDELIGNMKKNGIFEEVRVSEAMLKVDRANYVAGKESAYRDAPQAIGHGATISAPHMHAFAASHLLPYLHPGSKVLDIGSGSGYFLAVLYHLIEPEGPSQTQGEGLSRRGQVTGIEHIPELVDWSVGNLRADGLGSALDEGEIRVVAGDGRMGLEGGPYDVIHVGAAAASAPQALIDQLASPGRMFIPVGEDLQYIEHIDKDGDGKVERKRVMSVRYVPLTDREVQVRLAKEDQ